MTPARVLPAVLLASLGYFVDVYDLVLFSVVRVPSLRSLGLSGQEVFDTGVLLINVQMIGMLVGGFAWGVLGDKRGRLTVLVGSILTYSAANVANAFVHDVTSYAVLRFVAGVGLAGELGAGVTLVAELLPPASRGLGTTAVATVGVAGAIAAAVVGAETDWRTAYLVGGVMGLLLLGLRVSVGESLLFRDLARSDARRGSLLLLFGSREKTARLLRCVLLGGPTWFVVGVLVTFAPELGAAAGVSPPPDAGTAVLCSYVGLVAGDLACGLLSQFLRSRRKAAAVFLVGAVLAVAAYLLVPSRSAWDVYALCVPLGFSVGYWSVFVTTSAEQFGTNLRATVATAVPNLVRASTVVFTYAFRLLVPHVGARGAAGAVGAVCLLAALLSLRGMKESYGTDLSFVESDCS